MLFDLTQIPSDARPAEVLHWERIKRIKAKPIESGKFDGFEQLGWKMVRTCLSEDGIGLAAPQIGLFRKAILCREMDGDGLEYKFKDEFRLYINPDFESVIEEEKQEATEYCLSVPGKGYPISRWKKIVASWDVPTEEGEFDRQERTLEGWAARLFQHEFDHLNGISIPQRYELQNKPKKSKRKKKKRR